MWHYESPSGPDSWTGAGQQCTHPGQRGIKKPVVASSRVPSCRAAVVGSGPAGYAMVSALAKRGAAVTLMAPSPRRPSAHTLALFADQVDASLLGQRYERCVVVSDDGTVDLRRAYARLNVSALRDRAVSVATVVDDTACGVVAGEGGVVLRSDGGVGLFDVVVDATGAGAVLREPVAKRRGDERAQSGAFVEAVAKRPVAAQASAAQRAGNRPGPRAFQSAYGIWARAHDVALPPGTALFMDWRGAGVDDGGPPSFLYALADDDGRVLFEETVLASASAVEPDVLKARLWSRLNARGTRIDDVIDVEHVCIPMGGPIPTRVGRPGAPAAVPFGAALGLVSPLSGYSVARSVGLADAVAATIVAAVAAGDDVEGAVIDAVYDHDEVERRHLFDFALQAAMTFDQAQAARFFGHFFALPPEDWRGFLDGSAAPSAMRVTMLALFGDVDARLRRSLVAGAFSGAGVAVVKDLVSAQARRLWPRSTSTTTTTQPSSEPS